MRLTVSATIPAIDVDALADAVPLVLARLRSLRVSDRFELPSGASDRLRVCSGVHPMAPVEYEVRPQPSGTAPPPHFFVAVERDDATEVAASFRDAEGGGNGSLRLAPGLSPRTCQFAWADSSAGISGDGRIDVAHRTLRAAVKHTFLTGAGDIEVALVRSEWRLTAHLKVRGRSIARPAVAVAGLVGRPWIKRQIAAGIKEAPAAVARFNAELADQCGGLVTATTVADAAWRELEKALRS